MTAPDRMVSPVTITRDKPWLHVRVGARFLHCGEFNGGVALWFEFPDDEREPRRRRVFRIFVDREPIPEGWTHLASVPLRGTVQHVYEADR